MEMKLTTWANWPITRFGEVKVARNVESRDGSRHAGRAKVFILRIQGAGTAGPDAMVREMGGWTPGREFCPGVCLLAEIGGCLDKIAGLRLET